MPRIIRRWKRAGWAASAAIGLSLIFFGLIRYDLLSPDFQCQLALAIIAALIPSTVLDALDHRWRRAIDKALPRFLEGIAHAQLTGLPLLRAFGEAGEGVTGPLRGEVRLVLAKMSWGMSLEDALRLFMERVDTPLARRVATLIIEASRSGGVVEQIFVPLAQATATFQAMEEERKATLKQHMLVTYISFFIFLIVIYVLYTSFFVPMAGGGGMPAVGIAPIDVRLCWLILFHMGMILATLSGLIAGTLGEGRVYGGLKHVIVMLIAAYVVFREMVMPGWLWELIGLGRA